MTRILCTIHSEYSNILPRAFYSHTLETIFDILYYMDTTCGNPLWTQKSTFRSFFNTNINKWALDMIHQVELTLEGGLNEFTSEERWKFVLVLSRLLTLVCKSMPLWFSSIIDPGLLRKDDICKVFINACFYTNWVVSFIGLARFIWISRIC